MATTPASRTSTRDGDGRSGFGNVAQRLSTETKHSSKTTEFYAMVAAAYMISRGLTKSGSRDPYFDGGTNEMRDRDGR